MVLGDNIFFGHGLPELLAAAGAREAGGTVFGYQVRDPERYGVVAFDGEGRVTSIEEKPKVPRSDFAVTGLYVLDGKAPERAAASGRARAASSRSPTCSTSTSPRGCCRSSAWAGALPGSTPAPTALLEAGNFVRTIEERQNLKVGCPEEIAFAQGWIDEGALRELAQPYVKTEYGQYLLRIAGARGGGLPRRRTPSASPRALIHQVVDRRCAVGCSEFAARKLDHRIAAARRNGCEDRGEAVLGGRGDRDDRAALRRRIRKIDGLWSGNRRRRRLARAGDAPIP
jgi:hypothetical protein